MAAAQAFDVIIAGAGIPGATLALELAGGGLSVALIDPQPFAAQVAPSFDGRASAIAYSSFRAWDVVGVGRPLAAHAQRIEQILVTDGRSPGASSPAPAPVFLRFDAAEIENESGGEPLGYMLENRHIRAALAEGVAAAPIALMAPERVEGVTFEPACARVRLASGAEITAPLVVGAEGRGSIVRREAGIGVMGWDYPQKGVVATVRLERPHEGVAYEHFLPSGPFAILPLTDDRASLVWTERHAQAEALRAARPEVFRSLLQRRFGDFVGRVEVEGPTFVYPLALQLSEQLTAPRCALVGDSAHGIHPIAGQGLNLGLKDAAALAEVVVEAARRGEDIGSAAVLERFAAWRRFDNVALAAATDLFNRLFSNDHPAVRLVRDAGVAVVNRIGPARRFFMQEAGGAVGDLPRLLRGEVL